MLASSDQYDSAIRNWADIIGRDHVTTSSSQLRAAETGTFATGHSIPAIVRPGSREEGQECVRVANRFEVPVYPISSGRNCRYGSRVPAAGGCVLMDLGRM